MSVRDRADLPPGPWLNEPDQNDWIDPDTGYRCLMRRGVGWCWLGYVAVPESHPWYGVDYSAVDPLYRAKGTYLPRLWAALRGRPFDEPEVPWDRHIDGMMEVHGSLTYSGRFDDTGDVWWFGFDCAHLNDLTPGYGRTVRFRPEVYRDEGYVRGECESLARQLAEVAS